MNPLRGWIRLAALIALLAPASLWSSPASHTRYSLDPAASSLEFTFLQAGARSKGRFRKFDVKLDFAADAPETSRLEVIVDVASLDTSDAERDGVLRGPDLFDVARFPQARFVADRLVRVAENRYEAVGVLTIRDVERQLRVPFELRTAASEARMTGEVTIQRLAFGVGQREWRSTEWVGDDVTVSFALRLLPAAGRAGQDE